MHRIKIIQEIHMIPGIQRIKRIQRIHIMQGIQRIQVRQTILGIDTVRGCSEYMQDICSYI